MRCYGLSMALLLAACASTTTTTITRAADEGLIALLPDPAGLGALTAEGAPDQAEGDQLFRLINGGAELYLQHGFVRAIAQEYLGAGGIHYNLEIFQMTDGAAAEAIYTSKGGNMGAETPIGRASTFEEYYGLYLAGPYHFTVTASRTQGELRPLIEQIARAVAARVAAGEQNHQDRHGPDR